MGKKRTQFFKELFPLKYINSPLTLRETGQKMFVKVTQLNIEPIKVCNSDNQTGHDKS